MGRFIHQYGLGQKFLKNTLFSAEQRLCFFASTPTPPGPGAPETPSDNTARIAALEADLAALEAKSPHTPTEDARIAGIKAELAVLRGPATPPEPTVAASAPGPDTATADEQETIDTLRELARRTRDQDTPFYHEGHIPLDKLDAIIEKMNDEEKKDPEKPTFDADTIRVFPEFKRDLRDYDVILENIGDVEKVIATIKEDLQPEFTKAMGERSHAQRRLAEVEKELSATPPPQSEKKGCLEEEKKQFTASLKKANKILNELNSKIKAGPINPEELQQKIDKIRETGSGIFSTLEWSQDQQKQFDDILWQEYKDYFTTLRGKVLQEREKMLHTMLEKIDAVLIKRLEKERERWQNCKPELASKKEAVLKRIDEAVKEMQSVQQFEKLPLEERNKQLDAIREKINKTFQISDAQREQFQRMIGQKWTDAQYQEAFQRRTDIHEKELQKCKDLFNAGKLKKEEYDELLKKENTFHAAQLKRFAHLRDEGWTKGDYDEAIRIETEEQKKEALEDITTDPLALRERMAKSITAEEQSTTFENASKEDQEKALNVTDDATQEEFTVLSTNFENFKALEGPLNAQIKEALEKVDGWKERITEASNVLGRLESNKMAPAEKQKSLEVLEKAGEAITVADGVPFQDALGKFAEEYNKSKQDIAADLALLANPTLSPQEKRALLDKIEKDIDAAQSAVKDFQKTLSDNFQFFENRLRTFTNDVSNIDKAGGDVNTIVFLDLSAIHEIWKKVKEYVKHRYERKTKERIGIVGEKLFNYNLPGARGLSQEFRGTKEAAERDMVETEKKNLTNADAWEIRHHMHEAGNKDVLKGMIELLAERGRLRFDDPFLWQQLNKYQKKIFFDVNKPSEEMLDYIKLEAKIQKAMGYIWEFEFFNNMKRKNDSTYASKKKEYETKCDTIAEVTQDNGLNKTLIGLLQAWDNDNAAREVHRGLDVHTGAAHNMAKTVDPHLYEEIIEYGIQKGKMSPEDKIFYLIQGVARGLISYDRISYFDSQHLNTYAILEVFASGAKYGGRPTMQDYREWGKQFEEEGNPYKAGPKFLNWFWVYAMHKDKCMERIEKALGQGGQIRVDHDDVTPLCAYVTEKVADSLLIRQGNNAILAPTGVNNMAVGLQNYIETLALNSDDPEFGSRACIEVKRWLRAFVRFDAIGNSRMYTKSSDSRMRFSSGAQKPRSNHYYNHGEEGWTVSRYLEESREVLKMIDEDGSLDLYNTILQSNTKLDSETKVRDFIAKLKSKFGANIVMTDGSSGGATIPDIKDYETFYLYLGAILENILTIKGDSWIKENIFKKIRANLTDKNGNVLKPEFAGSLTSTKYDGTTIARREQARNEFDKDRVALFKTGNTTPAEGQAAHA